MTEFKSAPESIISAAEAAGLTFDTRVSRVPEETWNGIAYAINQATWDGCYTTEVEVGVHAGVIVEYLEEMLGYSCALLTPASDKGWRVEISWEHPMITQEIEEEC